MITHPSSFLVTDEEVKGMIEVLSKQEQLKDEVQYLSEAWVRAVMSKPCKNKKHQRRPFEYSQKKLMDYLTWRKESGITSKISYYIDSDGTELAHKTTSNGCFYWYGVDKDGSPIIWYLANLTNFDKAVVKDEMENTSLILQAVLDTMPPHIYDINFVICFDVFNPLKAMKRPNFAPAFIKTFMKICPDRLKSAVMVTGTIGHVFYKVANTLAPKSLMDKVVETRSREDAAGMLIEAGVLSEKEVPDFMGGTFVHDENITKNYPNMMKTIKAAMWKDVGGGDGLNGLGLDVQ